MKEAQLNKATFPSILEQNDCAVIKLMSYFCRFFGKHIMTVH